MRTIRVFLVLLPIVAQSMAQLPQYDPSAGQGSVQGAPAAPVIRNAPEQKPQECDPDFEADCPANAQRPKETEEQRVQRLRRIREQAEQQKPLEAKTDFQKMVTLSVGQVLPIFGQSLFEQNVPSTFAPVDHVPVTADYVIGPGDEVLVRAWGAVDIDYRATVDRSGNIYLPKVGNVNVAGIRFQQLHDYLKNAIGRVFKNFDLNVNMGQLRSIQVFVVGQARRPGSYTVSSLSTLVNTIFASGGPALQGSMRRIQLKRGTNVVTEFDLYDLLLRGDKSKDAALLPGDVIYIPPVGPLVAVSGSVHVPAIYELKDNSSLGDAISLAGGLTTTAAGERALVERIQGREKRTVEEFALSGGGLQAAVHDGDLVRLEPVSPRFQNAVTLRGNVALPGRFPWHTGMRVSDLIPNRDFLITNEYWNKQNVITAEAPNTTQRNQAELRNEVKRNAPDVNWDYAVVERLNARDLTTDLIPFNLGEAIARNSQADLELQSGDVVTIFSQADLNVPQNKQTKFVRLEGEFVAAGVYEAKPGETLPQLVERVGGLTPEAYLFGAQFTREATREQQQKKYEQFLAGLERDLEKSSAAATRNALSAEEAATLKDQAESQRRLLERLRQVEPTGRIVLESRPDAKTIADLPKIELQDGDRFMVPARPATVDVLGEVYNENAFLYKPSARAGQYLRLAGGPTRDADTGHTFILRADGSVISQRWGSGITSSGFSSARLNPGDTIIVPEQFNKIGFLKGLKDWSQVISQFALGVAAIRVIGRP